MKNWWHRGKEDAVERSNEEMEIRQPAQRIEERPASEEPGASGGDNAQREAGGEAGQEGIQGKAAAQE